MTTLDFAPLFRSTIGFDRLADLMGAAMADTAPPSSYPPYDVEAIGDDAYQITMAVAGFSREELDVDVHDRTLTVTGKRREEEGERHYLHRGIARRGFVRHFKLADHVKVTGANLSDGLLRIALERELPEALKPRTIEIGTDSSQPESKSGTVKRLLSKGAAA